MFELTLMTKGCVLLIKVSSSLLAPLRMGLEMLAGGAVPGFFFNPLVFAPVMTSLLTLISITGGNSMGHICDAHEEECAGVIWNWEEVAKSRT